MTIKLLMPYGRNTLHTSNAWLGGTINLDLAFGKNRALYHAKLRILAYTGTGWALSMVVSISRNWSNIWIDCGDYNVYPCALDANRGSLVAMKSYGCYKDSRTGWYRSRIIFADAAFEINNNFGLLIGVSVLVGLTGYIHIATLHDHLGAWITSKPSLSHRTNLRSKTLCLVDIQSQSGFSGYSSPLYRYKKTM